MMSCSIEHVPITVAVFMEMIENISCWYRRGGLDLRG